MGHSSSSTAQCCCFLCDNQAGSVPLHKASTFELDKHVRKCALKLEDKPLLAKLSAGDLITQEAKYHTQCFVSLYNKARDAKTSVEMDTDRDNYCIALAELVSYIEETRTDGEVASSVQND